VIGSTTWWELALQVGVGVVLAVVVPVAVGRRVRREAFQPVVDVLDQPRLVVVHVDGRGDVHGFTRTRPSRIPERRTNSSTSGVMFT
jgi:hypothetical protein